MFASLKDAYSKAKQNPEQFGEAAKIYIANYQADTEDEAEEKMFIILRFANNILRRLGGPVRQWPEVEDFIIKYKGAGVYYLEYLCKNNLLPSYKIYRDFLTDDDISKQMKESTAKLVYQSMVDAGWFWDDEDNKDFRQSNPQAYSEYYHKVILPVTEIESEKRNRKKRDETEFDVLEDLNRSINMLNEELAGTIGYQNL
jgi:hypothetical protein